LFVVNVKTIDMNNEGDICAYEAQDRDSKIKELLKDLESELPQPKFEQIKEELLQVLEG
jgi:hypothetical protein